MELRHRLAARLHWLHRLRCPWVEGQTPDHLYVGRFGELVAASWLRAHGYRILRRNFLWGDSGEVDVVCRKEDTLVFVEVKSGTVDGPYPLAHKVNREKRRQIRKGARNWFRLLGRGLPHRFDVVEVHLRADAYPVVRHIPDAFEPLVHVTPAWKLRPSVAEPHRHGQDREGYSGSVSPCHDAPSPLSAGGAIPARRG